MAQIDRDELRKKHALEHALEEIAQGKTQLMVGTQLLAKGHHFPALTLVVMVDADSGLYNQDFRSLERLGQLLLQVAGRAGRASFAWRSAYPNAYTQSSVVEYFNTRRI